MRKNVSDYTAVFAVFGAVVMLSTVFVQPVSARVSGQVGVLQRYDSYLKTIEEFGKKVFSDKSLRSLSNKLAKNSKLNNIIEQMKSAKTNDEMKLLAEKLEDTLTKQKEYKKIESLINMKYERDIKTLVSFVKKLQDKPSDTEALTQALLQKQTMKQNSMYYDEPEAFSVVTRSSPRNNSPNSDHANAASENLKIFHSTPNAESTHSVKAHGNDGSSHRPGLDSAHASVKINGNGDICIWVPGHGWMNPTLFGWCGPILALIAFILAIIGTIIHILTLILPGNNPILTKLYCIIFTLVGIIVS
ncbi:MAG TPA: hypothetical protein ENI45_04385 [Thermoplasmatales archaeon]|nr:hypothetical protein [Thermoplasmatales archaeon]